MRRGIAPALVAWVSACAPAPAPPPRVAPPPIEPPPAPIVVPVVPDPPSPGLDACALARLDVDFARLRAARRAAWIEKMLAADPRFGELAVPGKVAPFQDAGVVRFCADTVGVWQAIVLRHGLDDATVEDAIRVYAARVDRGGPLAPLAPGARADRVRVGPWVWVAVRARRGELLLVAPSAAAAAAPEYASAAVPVALPGEAVAALDVVEPAARFPRAGPDAQRLTALHLELVLRPDGSADASGVADARDEADARAFAEAMRDRVGEASRSWMVRVVLRGLLGGFSARAVGSRVELRLPATWPQVDSVLSLFAAQLGVRLD